jgi:hypothetical protein
MRDFVNVHIHKLASVYAHSAYIQKRTYTESNLRIYAFTEATFCKCAYWILYMRASIYAQLWKLAFVYVRFHICAYTTANLCICTFTETTFHKCAYMESWFSYTCASINTHICKLASVYAHNAHILKPTYVYAHLRKHFFVNVHIWEVGFRICVLPYMLVYRSWFLYIRASVYAHIRKPTYV